MTFLTAEDLEESSEPDLSRRLGGREYDVFGTANFFNFTAWQAAIEIVLGYGLGEIAARNGELVDRFISGLDPARCEIASPASGPHRSSLVFVIPKPPDSGRAAYERLRAAGVDAGLRRGRPRLSPHFYNTAADIDRALEALHGA